jgi:hypothetical protein
MYEQLFVFAGVFKGVNPANLRRCKQNGFFFKTLLRDGTLRRRLFIRRSAFSYDVPAVQPKDRVCAARRGRFPPWPAHSIETTQVCWAFPKKTFKKRKSFVGDLKL